MNAPQTRVPDTRLHHPHTALNLMTALGVREQAPHPEGAVLSEQHSQVVAVLQLLENHVRSTLEGDVDSQASSQVTFNLPGGARLVCDLSYEDPRKDHWYGEIARRVCRASVVLIEGESSTHFGAKWFIHDKKWDPSDAGIHRPPLTFTFSELAEDPQGGQWNRLTQAGSTGEPEDEWELRISDNPLTGTGNKPSGANAIMRRSTEDTVGAAKADSGRRVSLGMWVTSHRREDVESRSPKITSWPETARWTPPGRGETVEWTYDNEQQPDRRTFENGDDFYITSIQDEGDGTHSVWLMENMLIRAGVHYAGERPIKIDVVNMDGFETGERDFEIEWTF